MCGITGILAPKADIPIDRQLLKSMTDRLIHRGPDGDGLYSQLGLGLGHRRLAIIDLDSGAQPMATKDRSHILTYNGEIYNFLDLRKKLETQGFSFETECDTEVILAAYRMWGTECVHHFRGMFAFALWDNDRKILFLARDRMGIKPLHWSILKDGSFIFASEIKALMEASLLDRKIRLDAMEDFLALSYIPDPKTIFESVHKLAPGHCLVVKHGEAPRIHQYWRPPIEKNRSVRVSDDLLIRLKECVDLHMMADVPLGAFLSGGLDSSTVVMLMAELSKHPVKTCNIGLEDQTEDESAYADEVADFFATHHRSRFMGGDEDNMLDILTDCFDEPFADNSALPTYRVSGLAKESVKVALSGDGGDELFGGYRRYQLFLAEDKIRKLLPRSLRFALFKPLGYFYPKADRAPRYLRAKTSFESLSMSRAEAYFHTVARGVDRDRGPLMSRNYCRTLAGYHPKERFVKLARDVKGVDSFSMMQYIDMCTYLPGCILTKVDRTSMAHSLEVRVPLLDHHFITWATKLHPDHCIENGSGKAPMKAVVRGKMPSSVLDRRKQGFSIPVGDWLKKGWRSNALHLKESSVLFDSGYFSRSGVGKMVDDHLSGKRNHEDLLWSMIVLERQLHKYNI